MLRAQGVCALIGALCFGLPSAAAAQSMGVGVKGGLAIASIPLAGEVFDQVVGLQSIESSSKLGLGPAVTSASRSRRLFWFQPEALYVMKGANLTDCRGWRSECAASLHRRPVAAAFSRAARAADAGLLFGGVNFGMKLGSSANLDGPAATADIDLNRR